ncbi:zinc-ribbon and DUF3426 domain-containing protein [Massilia sp. Mn16-1_5]|uniref:zinc-ribbon and DUF3426 domain-containing protein n=1 Tax=Massilia sp. Mn16-1_5 TaxID=2079199 RepID=UPI00109EDD7B|nr:zinc-ribbon and DUF3426 domain-containing protein [Massilia sp. Mn16-1_5]THC42147.1 hypothetical protein C2862_16390 [Massilia sp. Mn16-1_5]
MALATQCPHCGTMFRVASDQLKLRGGIVRCGSCQEIFDGSATLVDLDALPAKAPVAAKPEPAPAPAAPEAAVLPEPAPTPEPEPAPAPVEASIEPPSPAIPEDEPLAPLEVAVELPNFDDQPVYTLDFDHTFDPFGILPKVDAPEAAAPERLEPVLIEVGTELADKTPSASTEDAIEEPPQPVLPPWSQLLKNPEPVVEAAAPEQASDAEPPAPEPALPPVQDSRIEPVFDLPIDEELVAAPLPGHEPETEPAAPEPAPPIKMPAADAPPPLLRESTASVVTPPAAAHIPPVARTPAAKRAEKAAARRSKLTPTRIEPQPKLRAAEIDEPEFVKRGRQQEQSGRTRKIALIAGSIALLVLLFAQGVLTFRNALAARYPAAKPALVSSCAVFGCRVELPAQADNLAIETGELTTLGGGAYSYTTELRNTGTTAQAWPSLELALLDANDKPLVRRVFAPRDYLGADSALPNGIAPRTEHAIKLHFRVDDLKPSGYHIAVFYP